MNTRNYVSNDHIMSVNEIATSQAQMIQLLTIEINDKDKKIGKLKEENQKLNNVLNELEKEINRLLERQYESEKFAKEQSFDTYLPAKVNLEYVKKRLNELKESDK